MKPPLTEGDYARAAGVLNCQVAAVKAVCAVEAPKGGFLADGRPTILFERHQFSRRTAGKWDESHPTISSKQRGGYVGGGAEHSRLELAASLDRNAALMSASWGKFQIMGFNHVTAGHDDLQSFVNAMYRSEGAQLDAFVSFLLRDSGGRMATALRGQKWADFARMYNGPAYAENRYDTKLAAAFKAAT